jgi:hypothetical protein
VPSLTYFVLFGMVITTVAGLVSVLRLLFGGVKVAYVNGSFADITYLEFIVLASLSASIVAAGVYNIFI